jgi:hypothetical protein
MLSFNKLIFVMTAQHVELRPPVSRILPQQASAGVLITCLLEVHTGGHLFDQAHRVEPYQQLSR